MAGGTSTPAFVTAVHRAGGLGFLAAGYKTVAAMQAEISTVRAAGARFGMNVFVPDPAQQPPSAAVLAELEEYRPGCGPTPGATAWRSRRCGSTTTTTGRERSTPCGRTRWSWSVSRSGCPGPDVVRALQRAGSTVLATVTTVAEALEAAGQGVDALVVQHASAGGHSAAFQPYADRHDAFRPGTTAELVTRVRSAVGLPLVAAGGVMDRAGLDAVLAAGAEAAQLGTAFLRTDQSGARQLHKDALADPHFTETRLTRAFTGRQARALVNEFVRDHPEAPEAYPAVHHLTAPLRAAAAAAGDAERLNLWAGTGWRQAQAGSVAEVMADLLG